MSSARKQPFGKPVVEKEHDLFEMKAVPFGWHTVREGPEAGAPWRHKAAEIVRRPTRHNCILKARGRVFGEATKDPNCILEMCL